MMTPDETQAAIDRVRALIAQYEHIESISAPVRLDDLRALVALKRLAAAGEELRSIPAIPTVYRFSSDGDLEDMFDNELRHTSAKPVDYLRSWLSMLRPFAFATKDDSWGEVEKLLCIVLRNYVRMLRKCHRVSEALPPTDGGRGDA